MRTWKFLFISLGCLILFFLTWFWIFHYPKERQNIEFRVWHSTKDSLKNIMSRSLSENDNLEFYCPYRATGLQSVLRVTYEDSLVFDLVGDILNPINDTDKGMLENRLKIAGYSEEKFLKEVVLKVRRLEKQGIYYLFKSDSTIKVVTSYYDSSYVAIKSLNSSYREEFYDSESFDGAKGRKFVISFLFLRRRLTSSSIFNLEHGHHYLWRLDSSSYYYRVYVPRNI